MKNKKTNMIICIIAAIFAITTICSYLYFNHKIVIEKDVVPNSSRNVDNNGNKIKPCKSPTNKISPSISQKVFASADRLKIKEKIDSGLNESELPQFDPEQEAFYLWENASYKKIDTNSIAKLVENIPMRLETEVNESEYDEIGKRVTQLLLLYSTRDPNLYISMFSKGGGIPQPDRVRKYQLWLKQNYPFLSDEILNNPIEVFKEEFRRIDEKEPMNSWDSVATELSKCRIYKSGGSEALTAYANLMPHKGSVISTHLRWDYPRTTDAILQKDGFVKYASITLQIEHKQTNEKFPLIFLFFWDREANTWQLKEGYSLFGKDIKHCIVM